MRFSLVKVPFGLILIAGLLQSAGAIAGADGPETTDDADTTKRKTVTREILASIDDPTLTEKSFRDRFQLHTKRGVSYQQSIDLGKQRLSLLLLGPMVKRKPGLKVQLQGLQIGGHEVVVKGYGTIKKQRIGFEMSF